MTKFASPTVMPPNISVPLFWPMQLAASMAEQGMELAARNVKFIDEEVRLHGGIKPRLATSHALRLRLRTLDLCDYSAPGAKGTPTLVDAPYAGHTSMIADDHEGQSLMQTLKANGADHLFLTDWHSATPDMKDLEVDQYLAELLACIDDLGGRVNLVGLCQGGWMAAMLAARFPGKVASLVLAGSPIDTHAGNGPLVKMVNNSPMGFYAELVESGGGLMLGKYMLAAEKLMGTPKARIRKRMVPGGHVGLFMGARNLKEAWPEIAAWIVNPA